MIIQSGEIQMMSHHSLEMGRMRRFQHKTSEVVLTPEERGQKAAQLGQNLQNFNTADSDETAEDGFLTVLNYRLDDAAAGNASEETDGMQVSATKKSALDRLMEGKSHEQRMQTLGYLLLQILYGRISGNYDMDLNTAAQDYLQQSTYTVDTYSYQSIYEEKEYCSFETEGMVQTADGRQISFGITVGMSRSFYQENSVFVQRLSAKTLDPLVLNVGADVTTISDQMFYFDLDGDGEEEYLHKLGSGSGFLALDRNGDGIINNGTELFGPNQGNGFEELELFDEDGNGWIDEADSIFSQLKIWEFNEDGEATLYSLKDRDVGAICLQRTETEFHLKDMDTNADQGILRETGIFLTEQGMAGTIQHFDYVV